MWVENTFRLTVELFAYKACFYHRQQCGRTHTAQLDLPSTLLKCSIVQKRCANFENCNAKSPHELRTSNWVRRTVSMYKWKAIGIVYDVCSRRCCPPVDFVRFDCKLWCCSCSENPFIIVSRCSECIAYPISINVRWEGKKINYASSIRIRMNQLRNRIPSARNCAQPRMPLFEWPVCVPLAQDSRQLYNSSDRTSNLSDIDIGAKMKIATISRINGRSRPLTRQKYEYIVNALYILTGMSGCHMFDDRESTQSTTTAADAEWKTAYLSFSAIEKLFIWNFIDTYALAAGLLRPAVLENRSFSTRETQISYEVGYLHTYAYAKMKFICLSAEIWKEACPQRFTCSWHASICVRVSRRV